MALLSSSVIAELDKRKTLYELKTGRLTPSTSPSSSESLQRRPLRSTPSKTSPGKPVNPAKPASPEELRQVINWPCIMVIMSPQQQIKKLMKELDEASNLDQPKVVKLGDASIASPFTSRHSSIECSKFSIPGHLFHQKICPFASNFKAYRQVYYISTHTPY